MTGGIMDGQISWFDQDTWCGKTYQAHSQAEHQKAATSQRSSKKSSKSANQTPMCVCVCRTTDGQNPAVTTLKMVPGQLLGDYTMHSFGEYPREENVSRLSQILQDSAHQKYSLSAKACQGILNRAKRRGKTLPQKLKAALEAQSVSKNEQENQGGGKGILIQNEHIGALSTLNNQSVLRLGVDFYNQALTGEATATLTSIRSDCDHVPCVMTVQAFGEYKESDKSSALKQRDYKDATDLVVCGVDTYNQTITGDVAATLNAASCDSPTHSGPSVLTSPTIVSSAYKGPGNTQDGLVTVSNDQVRRLTPLECERLQGFPDGWTDIGEWTDSKGKKHKDADSPRYKALGNSIALPFWFWLLRRISSQYERPATLASLFDGIGGFPLCWEKCNGKGTAIWASEIEEFPIAVTKKHFPEEGDD